MWDDGQIWAGARQGRLLLKACRNCARICHPPLPMCPHCQSLEWDERAASGHATLQSWLFSIRPDGVAEDPRIVIVAALAEGVAFVSNLTGATLAELREGLPLELCFEPAQDMVLPLFRLSIAA